MAAGQVRLGNLAAVDVGALHRLVVMPAASFLLFWIVLPTMLFSVPALTVLGDPEKTRPLAILARLAHVATISLVLFAWGLVLWMRWADSLAQSIRDDRYLVRRRLRNIDDLGPTPRANAITDAGGVGAVPAGAGPAAAAEVEVAGM